MYVYKHAHTPSGFVSISMKQGINSKLFKKKKIVIKILNNF